MSIEKVTSGSVAKNNKLNEVIAAINSLTGMTVRQGSSSESPKFVYGERKSELITTSGGGAGGAGGAGGSFELDVVKDDNTAGRASFTGSGII
tara:strand:- start:631 stop:909 length:279 start_codon:yes stop_codon:yes gene_type:complete